MFVKKNLACFLSLMFGLFLSLFSALGQQSVRDSSLTITRIDAFYSYCIPSGDLADRFGYFHTVGGGAHVKLKNNLQFGLDIGVQFGDQVKENTISNLVNDAGGVVKC